MDTFTTKWPVYFTFLMLYLSFPLNNACSMLVSEICFYKWPSNIGRERRELVSLVSSQTTSLLKIYCPMIMQILHSNFQTTYPKLSSDITHPLRKSVYTTLRCSNVPHYDWVQFWSVTIININFSTKPCQEQCQYT